MMSYHLIKKLDYVHSYIAWLKKSKINDWDNSAHTSDFMLKTCFAFSKSTHAKSHTAHLIK